MSKRVAYHKEYMSEDGINDRVIHSVDHDGGGFMVSSEIVGLAVQDFMNNATTNDIWVLHSFLLYAFKDAWAEQAEPEEESYEDNPFVVDLSGEES